MRALGLAVVLTAGTAWADLRVVDSVEWLASQADVVSDGVVVEFRPFTGGEWVLTMDPRRGLKGGSADGMLYVTADAQAGYRPGERLITFGVRRPGWGLTLQVALREGATVIGRDGQKLTGLAAIAKALAQADKQRRARPVYFSMPQDNPDDTASLRVPADVETERLLVARLASPLLGVRAEAALSLEPFESRANVARLRALLADTEMTPGNNVRVACTNAAFTLRRWEVPVPPDACAPRR